MTTPVLVPTAALAPGVCFLSGDNNGPFIDTGKNIPKGGGRVYLSVKSLAPLLRESGWIPEADVKEQLAGVKSSKGALKIASEDAKRYRDLVEAVSPFIPTPDPEVRQVAVFKDDRVRRDNEALRQEIDNLRSQLHEATQAVRAAQTVADPAPGSEGSAPVDAGSATTTEVNGGTVNLDELLKENVQTVVAVAEGWPQEGIAALIAAEEARAEAASVPARKTILALASA